MSYYKKEYKDFKKDKDKKKDFDLIKEIIIKGLFHINMDVNFYDFDKILIDLDSLLSIVIREELSSDRDVRIKLAHTIADAINEFIEAYIDTNTINIYYNLNEYKVFSDIYPDWCKVRNDRFKNESIVGFLHKYIINHLKKASDKINNFNIIKCDDAPIITIFRDIKLNPKLKYVVISRDPHYNCIMSYYDISIFNGRDLVDRGSLKYLKDLPDINYTMLPFYYLIRGMDRNEYKGVKLYGQKKTEKYINENLTTLITWEDPILEEVKPYKNIFFLNDLKIDS
jgi:hypothetical protein